MKSRRFPRHFRTQAAAPAGIGNFSAKSGSLRELGRSDRERVHDAQAGKARELSATTFVDKRTNRFPIVN